MSKREAILIFVIAILAAGYLGKDEPTAALIVEEKRENAQPALQLPLYFDLYMKQSSPGEMPRYTYYTRPENRR